MLVIKQLLIHIKLVIVLYFIKVKKNITFYKFYEVNMINDTKIEKIQPLYDRVLIKRSDELANKTPGGIIIPQQAQERAQTGTVIATGAGKILSNGAIQPLKVKVGDTVFFGKYAGTEINDAYIIVREEEILAII